MDRKRKSVFLSHRDETNSVTKKHRLKDSDVNKSFSTPSSFSDNTRNDVQVLRDLMGYLTPNIQNSDIQLSAGALKAAVDLTQALQRMPPSRNPPASSAGIDAAMSPKPSYHDIGLPPLPPIMDPGLERAAFTHPGMRNDPQATYDRLEILGDAYIELIATKLIWHRLLEIPSGRISQIRETLVKNETLAGYATKYGLDSRASVPRDYSNQPKRWTKTKGDLFEAYVAAVILSHPNGYSVAEQWLSQLWSPKLDTLEELGSNLQAKETLAKKVMRKGVRLRYIDEKPPVQHEGGTQTFYIGVYLTGWGWNNKHLGSGQGLNKTIAGNKAAQQALENEDIISTISTLKASYEIDSS
ncbi:ribonuclease III [Aspergillus lucknowensis]|uniref:Ribonuclease III domain-containing protein n=1 Tax=Aspergillus lucknowensis TaxID=176173 RepID=A0ABR4L5H9_9EURO